MLKRNTKYTAKEILTEAGIGELDKVFGKLRVRIAGLRGIVTAGHVITIPENAVSPMPIVVGNEAFEVELSDEVAENRAITPEAKKTIEAKGKKMTEKANAVKEIKKEAKKEPQK